MTGLATTVLVITEHAETMSALEQGWAADEATGPMPYHASRWYADRLMLHGFPFAGDLLAADFDDLVYTFTWADQAWCDQRSSEGDWLSTDRWHCLTCRLPASQCTDGPFDLTPA